MAEQIVQTNIPNDILKKELKMQEFANLKSSGNIGITRERSFVRMSSNNSNQNHHQNVNKRRSLAFTPTQHQQQQQQQQLRVKPAMEIYRPPNVRVDGGGPQNKLNVHAQEFQMNRDMPNSRSSIAIFPTHGNILNHSKSGNNLQQQMQQLAARQHAVQMANLGGSHTILVSHPIQLSQMGAVGVTLQSSQMPLVNSPSSGNLLHSTPRVKFAPEPQLQHHHHQNHVYQNKVLVNNNNINNNNILIGGGGIGLGGPLQRSKSLSSADTIARGIAGLGLAIGNEATDIGTFIPEIQTLVDQATKDPNQLNARSLMELANHIMQRAVEGRRYALPTSRFCISIIAKEQKETFLEALLNTCRQWYQEREKVLGPPHSIKNSSRPRFTAFMAFLTEMFCQLKRRQLQLRTKCDGVPPPIVLLTLLSKCCENCVKPPVRSLSEIECLFFVLTCIGRDLECHLPQQLESLLASVRDAFLNSNASAPAIRRTLLQLIELQASRWQLPGNTVLYYYPSSK